MSGTFTEAFSSLRVRDYRILWWAGLFAFISVQMQFLLRGILAWDLTEREGALGLVYLCFGLAMLVATPLGGVATDRFARRTILVVTQAVMTFAAVGMGVVVITGQARFWMLLIAALLQGAAFGFFGPARVALSAEYVGREQLGNAIALSLLSLNGTRIFAPALAGIFAGVAFIGIGGAYLIAAAMSLIGFGFVLALPASSPSPATGGATDAGSRPAPRRSPWADIVDGVRYVLAKPPLRRLVLSSFLVIMFGFNYIAFYPAMVEGVFGLDETWVGYISSASALGAVAVAVPLAGKADSPIARPAMVLGGLLFGVGVIAFGLSPSFWFAFVAIMLTGAATTTYQSLSNTLALTDTDTSHQGRVQSLMQLSFAGFGLAAAPLGFLAEVIGLRAAVVLMGSAVIVSVTVYAMLEGGPRILRARQPTTSPTSPGPAPVGTGVPGGR
ncbi:MAG: MFS transporter [Actinomycetota bacterium]